MLAIAVKVPEEVGSSHDGTAAVGFVPALNPFFQEALGGKLLPADALFRAGFTVERAARGAAKLALLLVARSAQRVPARQRTCPPDNDPTHVAYAGGVKAIDEVQGSPVELIGETSNGITLAAWRHLCPRAREP